MTFNKTCVIKCICVWTTVTLLSDGVSIKVRVKRDTVSCHCHPATYKRETRFLDVSCKLFSFKKKINKQTKLDQTTV